MTAITIAGNATADAELRYLSSGAAVTTVTVAVTDRVKQGDAWVDGETAFYRCSVWRQAAEHAAESITKGMRVIVTGRLKPRTYTTKEGVERLALEIDVEDLGPSLKFKPLTGGGGSAPVRQQPIAQSSWSHQSRPAAPAADPWASARADDVAPF